jgi:hypothetical protein
MPINRLCSKESGQWAVFSCAADCSTDIPVCALLLSTGTARLRTRITAHEGIRPPISVSPCLCVRFSRLQSSVHCTLTTDHCPKGKGGASRKPPLLPDSTNRTDGTNRTNRTDVPKLKITCPESEVAIDSFDNPLLLSLFVWFA